MAQEIPPRSGDETHECLRPLKVHWAEAQVDSPLHTIARYDDVAKLLITIGGFVLAILANAYSMMLKDLPKFDPKQVKSASSWIFGSMLVFFVVTAVVCYWQPKMWAMEILAGREDEETIIKKWCKNINRVLLTKKILLMLAVASFIVSFLVMMRLFLNLLSVPR